ncbi:hypothetical protein WICPIJ_000787 [Wickerhamomyces pijperi]|uniref:Protein YIP n=1 Tax=Wickerhamomyces pijperi TaxID=599730 RepID=A0A9P8TS38_WICPI|nr:hypothetical protein WICPIJ_000787 [Wickerhamomyces pijperi]
MSHGWKPVNINPEDADDFEIAADTIEPDIETPLSKSSQKKITSASTSKTTQPAASSTSNNDSFFNFSTFTQPNIDLSKSFNPLMNNEQVRELRFSGGDTLDEPVWKTLQRDLNSIGTKLFSVIWPASLSKLAKIQQHNLLIYAKNTGINVGLNYEQMEANLESDINQTIDDSDLKKLDWDLWGPLVFILIFSVILGMLSPTSSSSSVFSGVFSLIWFAFGIIAINIQLLGGTISFFSALSTTGYALFPLLISATISVFVKLFIVRFVCFVLFVSWAIYAATVNLKVNGVLPGRIFLAIYPVSLIYATLGWLCVIT